DQEEIVEFAKKFDPQYFHTDPKRAEDSIYGGLIASGWHTASMVMRLLVENYLPVQASLGSPGVDELRWLKPVYPGDQLNVRTNVLESKRSRSKTDRGIITTLIEVINQDREMVMSLKAVNFLLLKPKNL
ncbi:uncharacterized protein METZ01_LOCUS149352, partial [marine metagenome]